MKRWIRRYSLPLALAVGLSFLVLSDGLAWATNLARLHDIRMGTHRDHTRLVFDMQGAHPSYLGPAHKDLAVSIHYQQLRTHLEPQKVFAEPSVVSRVALRKKNELSEIYITLRLPDVVVRPFFLPAIPPRDNHYRLVLDFYPPSEAPKPTSVAKVAKAPSTEAPKATSYAKTSTKKEPAKTQAPVSRKTEKMEQGEAPPTPQPRQESREEKEVVESAEAEVESEPEEPQNVFQRILEKITTYASVVPYYQHASVGDNQGEDFGVSSDPGISADFELEYEAFDHGDFYLRVHAGTGDGADKDLEQQDEAYFADLNALNDDNTDDNVFSLLEFYYTHHFMGNQLSLVIGKTDPEAFIDDNAYANDAHTQFVGKPFVNNSMLDWEDEYAPMIALEYIASVKLKFNALVASSSQDDRKSVYSDVFDQPFFAAQVSYAPGLLSRDGTYRLYFWDATYDHEDLADEEDTNNDGWGVGVSLDQEITDKAGIFARAGYANEDVYDSDWFWALGANLLGIIPTRSEDVLGLGLAGLKGSDKLYTSGMEYHLETYYRVFLSDYFALTPADFQYVINPYGDSDNDNIFAYMVRGEFSF